ncbi:MAG: hypothetical protein ABSA41_05840 [Terriglobia bacterium]
MSVLEADGQEREQRKLSRDRVTLQEHLRTIPRSPKVAVEATFN